ncbi:MAG: cation:proton antiporter, partial [Rhodothermales bacterium]|nr:cation:proton antiporter [Rhodothermales bacterium]
MELSILNLLLVLIVAWVAGRVASRFGYPSVLGELLAGIALGPPLLGLLEGGAALNVLAEVGILLMMVYIGMEIDPRSLGKASKAGLLAAVGGFVTPFVLCYFLVIAFGGDTLAAIFVGVAAGVTSLATKSRILVDLQLLDTRIAYVMMAGALIADTVSLVIFAAILGVAETDTFDAAGLLIVAAKAIAFFAVAALVGIKGFPWVGRFLQSSRTFGRTSNFMLILIAALAYAEMAHLAGMHGILGAFVAGLFLREGVFGKARAHELMGVVRDASIGFLAPIFFVTAGFAVSLDVFRTDLALLVGVVGLASIGKIVGTALFYLPTGHGWREGLTIGAGMNGRGAVEIIIAQIGLTMGLITQEVFSILVFMAIFTTATVPVFLKWGTEWLRRRGELVRTDDERSGVLIIGGGSVARATGRLLARSQPVT